MGGLSQSRPEETGYPSARVDVSYVCVSVWVGLRECECMFSYAIDLNWPVDISEDYD